MTRSRECAGRFSQARCTFALGNAIDLATVDEGMGLIVEASH